MGAEEAVGWERGQRGMLKPVLIARTSPLILMYDSVTRFSESCREQSKVNMVTHCLLKCNNFASLHFIQNIIMTFTSIN